jgi:ABC-type glycerol-3-phosphate transport system substrate-binding protein
MPDSGDEVDDRITRRRIVQGSPLVLMGLAGCSGGDGGDGGRDGGDGGDGGDGMDGGGDGGDGGSDGGDGGGDGGSDGGNGGDTETPTPGMPGEVTFLHFETDEARRTKIEELASAWAEESGVAVNQRVVPEADLPTQISSAVASNTLPAVGELSNRALYSARDAVSTDDATQVIEELGEDTFYDPVLRLVSDGEGGYVGVPLYTWQQLIAYRESVAEEMGLPVPSTWEDFETFAEATHDPDNDVYGCLLGSDQSQFTLQCFQQFALANDAAVFDEDGDIVFDDDPMVEALEFYARMARKYNPPGEMGPGDVGPVWNQGQTHLYSTNTISFYFEALGVDEGETVEGFGVVPTWSERAKPPSAKSSRRRRSKSTPVRAGPPASSRRTSETPRAARAVPISSFSTSRSGCSTPPRRASSTAIRTSTTPTSGSGPTSGTRT